MGNALIVGVGGFAGSIARYLLGGAVTQWTTGSRFPWGTAVVNIVGCLAIGLLGGFAETRNLLGPTQRVLLFTGVLGGFTTFSAFGFETMILMRDGAWRLAAANVGLQVIVGIAAVWIGYRAVVFTG